jgi:hypothetical protein
VCERESLFPVAVVDRDLDLLLFTADAVDADISSAAVAVGAEKEEKKTK